MRVKTEEYLRRLTEENYVAAQNAAKDAGFEIKGGRTDASKGNYRLILELGDPSKAAEVKDAVEKKADPRNARASLLSLTAHGKRLSSKTMSWPDYLSAALGDLSEPEREVMLVAVTKMIRSLQASGLIPTDRMCVTCRYFRPNVHRAPTPHHCALVDAPMAQHQLRIECAEHERADDAQRDEAWKRFMSG